MYKKLKKIFGLFAMAAVAATGLTCCGGGGGGDNQDYVTARQFASGKGITLYGIPNLTFVEGYSGEATNDNLVGVPNLSLPGTGKPAVEDNPDTPEDETQEEIPDTPLHAIGKSEVVTRKVMISGNSPHTGKTTDVTAIYTETEENISVIELSFGTTAAEDKDFITALGVAAAAAEQNNQGGGDQGTLDRITIDSLGACSVTIYLDFNTGYANTIISATGVSVRDEDDNEGYTADSVVISASAVRFAI